MTDAAHTFQQPVDRWFDAISKRHSRRTYSGQSLPEELLSALEVHCASVRPFPASKAVLIREAPAELFVSAKEDRAFMTGVVSAATGIIGSYGRITGVASALAFVGRSAEDTAGGCDNDATDFGFAVEEQVGYTGEAAVLEATALGLDTCWVGGFFSPSLTARLIDAQPGERVLAVTPIGYGADDISRKERLLYRMGKPKKRRGLEHIALGLATKNWPSWAIAGVRAAQTAPSAVNRQPWRFRLDGHTVIIACDMPDRDPISRRIDCGIAMLHFEIGVRRFGRSGAWEPPGTGEPLDVARWRHGA
jgi:nitroreductase